MCAECKFLYLVGSKKALKSILRVLMGTQSALPYVHLRKAACRDQEWHLAGSYLMLGSSGQCCQGSWFCSGEHPPVRCPCFWFGPWGWSRVLPVGTGFENEISSGNYVSCCLSKWQEHLCVCVQGWLWAVSRTFSKLCGTELGLQGQLYGCICQQ